MNQIKIITPLPNPELSPNKKAFSHWSKTNKYKKSDQDIGFYLMLDKLYQLGYLPFTVNDRLEMIIMAIYGDNRRHDNGNTIHAFKAIEDGLFKALKVDDSQVDITTINKTIKDKTNPRLEITIRKIYND